MSRAAISPKPKLSRCKVCHDKFAKSRSIQPTCGKFDCNVTYAQRIAAKAAKKRVADARKNIAARKEAVKTRSDWMKEAQIAFNAWVKLRDADLPCVSCGRYHQGAYHAGHYLSVGARPELRFEPLNVWKQCAPCNLYLSGNLVLYRQELVRRIGIQQVERLEGPHELKKLGVEDLKQIIKKYRDLARQLKGGVNG